MSTGESNKEYVPNTAPMYDLRKDGLYILRRRFKGDIFSKDEKEQKELKAYVKGASRFSYKRDRWGYPQYYEVRQEYYYERL
jgi:hypothetical protein